MIDQSAGVPAQRLLPSDVRALFGTREQVHVVRVEGHARYQFQVLLDNGTHVGFGEREAFDFAFIDLAGCVLGRMPLVAVPPALAALIKAAAMEQDGSASQHKKRSSSGVGTGKSLRKGNRLKQKDERSASSGLLNSPGPPTSPSSLLAGSKARSATGSALQGRRLSEWQNKLRNSGPFKPTTTVQETAGAGGTPGGAGKLQASKSASSLVRSQVDKAPEARARSESVDYTPDGLSPGLEDSVKAYDPEGKHRPMGLAGLLGEPDDDDGSE